MEHRHYDFNVWSGFIAALVLSLYTDAQAMQSLPASGLEWYVLALKYLTFIVAAAQTAWARNKTASTL